MTRFAIPEGVNSRKKPMRAKTKALKQSPFLTIARSAFDTDQVKRTIEYLVAVRRGEAEAVVENYKRLTPAKRRELGTMAAYLVSALEFELAWPQRPRLEDKKREAKAKAKAKKVAKGRRRT